MHGQSCGQCCHTQQSSENTIESAFTLSFEAAVLAVTIYHTWGIPKVKNEFNFWKKISLTSLIIQQSESKLQPVVFCCLTDMFQVYYATCMHSFVGNTAPI
jgi:hypothetical protein